MELHPLAQIAEVAKKAQKILILAHRRPDGDAIGSSLALALALRKLGKDSTLVCTDSIPETFDFLPGVEQFERDFASGSDLIITIDCAKAKVGKLRYNIEGGKMNIVVSPQAGSLSPEQVTFSHGKGGYDLVFVLDTADFAQLGEVYTQNTDFFYNATVINIDHHATNTEYGKINYIDRSASSTAEILPELIGYLGKDLMDADIATFLLMGIITDTGSFQNPNTSPNSFEVAASLLEKGGRQQEIIRRVYKTKKLETLKLWGRILSKVKYDSEYKLVWSSISATDLQESGAGVDDAGGIIDELLTDAPEAEIILLLKEYDGVLSASLRTTSAAIDATKIAKVFGGGGHVQAAGFKLAGNDLAQFEQEVLRVVRDFQAARLGIASPSENA